MLLVVAKSVAALVVGGAMLGQQVDTADRNIQNQDVAPPAPSVTAPQQNVRSQVNDQRREVQQDVDRSVERSGQNINQRQTFDQQRADDQSRAQQRPDNLQQGQQGQQGRAALGVTLSDDLTVTHVEPGSPAERMGLRPGDEVLSLNGQSFDSAQAFIDAIGSTPQGQDIQLEVDRDGQTMTQRGQLAAWDRIHYSGSHMAGRGVQQHSAMRYSQDGSVAQGAPVDGSFAGNFACCDPCAGYGGGFDSGYGYGHGGYGYGGWDGGWNHRAARRAARRGYYW